MRCVVRGSCDAVADARLLLLAESVKEVSVDNEGCAEPMSGDLTNRRAQSVSVLRLLDESDGERSKWL